MHLKVSQNCLFDLLEANIQILMCEYATCDLGSWANSYTGEGFLQVDQANQVLSNDEIQIKMLKILKNLKTGYKKKFLTKTVLICP